MGNVHDDITTIISMILHAQRHPALNNVSCAVLWGEEKVAGLVQAYDLLGRITL